MRSGIDVGQEDLERSQHIHYTAKMSYQHTHMLWNILSHDFKLDDYINTSNVYVLHRK